MADSVQPPARKTHRIAVPALVVAGTLALFLAIAALWVNRQALDTDNWTDASSQMLEEPAIRTQVAGYMVDQLYANVDVAAEIRAALPERAQPLAGTAAGALRNVAEDATNALLQRPRVEALWEGANRAAHGTFLDIVEGGGETVSTENGVVSLDLRELLQRLADQTGVGAKAAAKIPPDAAQLTIMKSDELSFAQDVVDVLRPLPIVLILLALALFAGAITLARERRREIVRAAGFSFIVAGVLALLLRSVGQDVVVNALAGTEAVEPAVESVWRIGTSLLYEAATASIAYGVVIVFAAWLAGRTRAAVATRRALAPYLREARYAWGATSLIVLLVLLWGPTPATRKLAPALLLIALLALGLEVLRRKTAREFPDARSPEAGASLGHALERVRLARRERREAHNGHAVAEDRTAAVEAADPLAKLERLTDLRDRGALSDAEFAERKQEILTAG